MCISISGCCLRCIAGFFGLIVFLAGALIITHAVMLNGLSLQEGSCVYLPTFTCEAYGTAFAAAFEKAEFSGANNVTTTCDVNNVYLHPGLPVLSVVKAVLSTRGGQKWMSEKIRGVPDGSSPTGANLTDCQSAAANASSVSHSCYLIGPMIGTDLCNVDANVATEKPHMKFVGGIGCVIVGLCCIGYCMCSGGNKQGSGSSYAAIPPASSDQFGLPQEYHSPPPAPAFATREASRPMIIAQPPVSQSKGILEMMGCCSRRTS